jgi:hypothetical protein
MASNRRVKCRQTRYPDPKLSTVHEIGASPDFGRNGRAYLETDTAEADRGTIIRKFISGEYETPVRVVAFNTAEGWSRDVSEDIAYEVLDQAHAADETLTEGTKRFIDR